MQHEQLSAHYREYSMLTRTCKPYPHCTFFQHYSRQRSTESYPHAPPPLGAGTGNTFRRRFQQRACSSRQAAAQAGAGGQHGRGLKTSKGNDWNRQKYIRNITFISLYEFFLFCPRIVPALSPHCPRCPTPSKPAWMLDSSILSPLSPLFWRI